MRRGLGSRPSCDVLKSKGFRCRGITSSSQPSCLPGLCGLALRGLCCVPRAGRLAERGPGSVRRAPAQQRVDYLHAQSAWGGVTR